MVPPSAHQPEETRPCSAVSIKSPRPGSARSSWRIVFGVLTISFAIWGIGDIFRGFGENEVAKVGGHEISIEQFRQYYNDQLRQFGRQRGRADHPRAGARRRPRPPDPRPAGRRDRAQRSTPITCASASATPTIAQRITRRSEFPRAHRPVRPQRVRARDQRGRLHRSPLRRRAAQRAAAPSDRDQHRRQHAGAEDRARGASTSSATKSAASTISRSVRPRPAPSRRRRRIELTKYFDERKALFRAPEYRKIAIMSVTPADLAKPAEVSDADAKSLLRAAQGPVRPAREARGAADHLSEARGSRRRARENHQGRQASPTSPRRAA